MRPQAIKNAFQQYKPPVETIIIPKEETEKVKNEKAAYAQLTEKRKAEIQEILKELKELKEISRGKYAMIDKNEIRTINKSDLGSEFIRGLLGVVSSVAGNMLTVHYGSTQRDVCDQRVGYVIQRARGFSKIYRVE